MENKELKNGVELILSLALSLDLLEQYKCKTALKNHVRKTKKAIEDNLIEQGYNKMYLESEEYTQNLLTLKENYINRVAKYNEADFALLSHFTKHFDDNIEIARKKGILFFDKIL